MHRILLCFITLVSAGHVSYAEENSPTSTQVEKDVAIQLFNGKDLTGWNGDPKWFRAEEGAIVAGNLNVDRIPHNYFLATDKKYHDFELSLQIKLRPKVAGQRVNGGIQFRSVRVPNNTEMSGYQADVGDGVWGSLYDESRRRRFLTPKADPKLLAGIVKPDAWNDYRLRCKGNRIQIWVNGTQISDYEEQDDDIAGATGYIAVQVHSARHPVEILYKDLYLTEL